MKAIVFFDLDATFLDNSKNIPINNIKAVQQLKTNHVLPVICTGRNLSMVEPIMHKTGITSAICGNGNYIVYNNKAIYKSHIKQSEIEKLLLIAKMFHDPIAFQTHNHVVLNMSNKYTDYEYHHRHHTNPPVNPQFYKKHRLVGCNIFTLHHDKYYQRAFKGHLSIVRNSNLCLDVQNKGISKGSGVQEFVKHFKMQVPTYAFGDGRNDAPMLKVVTHGIAMSNGWNFIKKQADYVTSSNENDGITKGLKHYNLIK